MDLNERLKKKREERNYTQKELAELLNVSRQTISSWEVGRTYPDLDIIVKLSDLYKIPLDLLLKEDSKLVETISEKARKSERRKILNYVLLGILSIFIGVAISGIVRESKNGVENEAGLRPSDLVDSVWQLHLDPSKTFQDSFISFGEQDMLVLNEFSVWILPFMDPNEIQKKQAELEEKGLENGLTEYKLLTIETKGNKYIVSALGYYQEFTKLSDTIIRDMNGTEYKIIEEESAHDLLYSIADYKDL
ncbi:MAG: helix-turn-helix transcriptional regulator [Lactobacillales bacterium]|nr:helix-turn-helix transcriptional regulator [Lactobacillales bacterium]